MTSTRRTRATIQHAGRRCAARLILLGVAFVSITAGCSSHDADSPGGPGRAVGSSGGTVRVLMPNEPASLSLLGKADRNSEVLAVQITDSLVQYDANAQLVPRLATDWEWSPDHLELTFRLRTDVRWHDGQPFTAADVVFSVEAVRRPAVENRPFAPLFAEVVEVIAVDDHTVRVRYLRPNADALEAWRLPMLPKHVAARDTDLLTGEFARHPVGCGPFRFVHYRPGEEIALQANDEYWDGRPTIDRLVFRLVPDQRTALLALLGGGLDVMTTSPESWRATLESPEGSRLGHLVYYAFGVWQIGFNQDGTNPFFADPRVRRALLLALDRPTFLDSVLLGLALPAATSFHPQLRWTDPGISPWPYDPETARRLLDAAGWRDSDGDGIRDRDGRPFQFTLLVASGSLALIDHMAAWQQQSWREIGVRAEVRKLEWAHFREVRAAHEFEAMQGHFGFTPSPDHFDLYHSSAREAGSNFVGFSDAEVDRLVELGRTVFDVDERRRILHALQRRLHELQPIACLFHFGSPVLHDPRLSGLQPSPLDIYRTTQGPRLWRWAEPSTR